MKTVILCVPTRGQVYHGTAQVLSEFSPHYCKSKFSVVDARNQARALCLRSDRDVLLMVDDDVVPSPELFHEGLEDILSGNLDICIFPCPLIQASGKVLPNLYEITEGDAGSLHPKLGYKLRHSGGPLEAVDAGGFGCVAITRKALETIGPFAARLDTDTFSIVMGEDIDYCLRAQNLGLSVKASMHYLCDHMMEMSGARQSLAYSELISELATEPRFVNA